MRVRRRYALGGAVLVVLGFAAGGAYGLGAQATCDFAGCPGTAPAFDPDTYGPGGFTGSGSFDPNTVGPGGFADPDTVDPDTAGPAGFAEPSDVESSTAGSGGVANPNTLVETAPGPAGSTPSGAGPAPDAAQSPTTGTDTSPAAVGTYDRPFTVAAGATFDVMCDGSSTGAVDSLFSISPAAPGAYSGVGYVLLDAAGRQVGLRVSNQGDATFTGSITCVDDQA
ncbi:MAG: hypothetical protein ACT4QG_02935 [Sporichthyaceae bacterium]